MSQLEIEDFAQKISDFVYRETSNAEFVNDPVGYTSYAYLLLKWNRHSQPAQFLERRTHDWVQRILSREEFTRYVDRDLASACFGFYLLSKHNVVQRRLKDDTQKVIQDFLREDQDHFFRSFLYTVFVALAMRRCDLQEESEKPLRWLKGRLLESSLYNDPKLLVFMILLLEEAKDRDQYEKIAVRSLEKIKDKSTRDVDRIFHAWVLWRLRKTPPLVHDKKTEIRKLVADALSASREVYSTISEPPRRSEERALFGRDLRKRPPRIWASVLYDLLLDFKEHTVITSEEVEWPIRLPSLALGFLTAMAISYLVPYSAFVGMLSLPPSSVVGVVVNSLIAGLTVLGVLGIYIFMYLIGVRGVHTHLEIKRHLKTSSKYFAGTVLVGIVSNAVWLITRLLVGL